MSKPKMMIHRQTTYEYSGELTQEELEQVIRDHFDAPATADVAISEYNGASVSWKTIEEDERS